MKTIIFNGVKITKHDDMWFTFQYGKETFSSYTLSQAKGMIKVLVKK